MSAPKVRIHELRVRVPGLTPEQGRRLGETVAQRLAESPLPADGPRRIPSIAVHVRSNGGSSIEKLVEEVVAGIRRRLA
jgi:hypothetical protein